MIRGQVHDMRQDLDGETAEEDRLMRCYLLKSAALYGVATKMGGILTGASRQQTPRSSKPQASISASPTNSSTTLPMSLPASPRSARNRAWMPANSPQSICLALTVRS